MKKNKKKIIILLTAVIIIMIAMLLIFNKYPNEKSYLNYLENRYNKEFIIQSIVDKSELKDVTLNFGVYDNSIDLKYFKGYNVTLKENKDINFIVGYGKFQVEAFSISKHRVYVDNYDDTIKKYLQDKYFTTIMIDSNDSINDIVNQIQMIVDSYNEEIEHYNLIGGATNFTGLNLNIFYDGKIKENVECSNYTINSGRLESDINELKTN